jgi:hypothetical protein
MKNTMKKLLTFNFIAIIFVSLLGISAAAQNSSPTLLKRTINVSVKRYMRWWKNPSAAEPVYNTYSWVPQIQFTVLGAIPAGSQLYAEFDTADGKPWINYKMFTRELEDDMMETIKIDNSISDDELEKKAVVTEGVYPFRIRLKNAAGGVDRVLFSGKYRVGTYALDQNIVEFKGKKDFYFDFDWQIPFAYLWLDPQFDENMPWVSTMMCFRGAGEQTKMEAALFYNGKEISKNGANSANRVKQTMTSAADEAPYRWTMWQFEFANVRGFDRNAEYNSSLFFLDKNPGEYEIKVTRDGQPARSLKFTVGKDGKIVDNGVKDKNQIGGVRMIFPVSVIGAADGKWNASAWKTDALYGNPLVGFTAVQ